MSNSWKYFSGNFLFSSSHCMGPVKYPLYIHPLFFSFFLFLVLLGKQSSCSIYFLQYRAGFPEQGLPCIDFSLSVHFHKDLTCVLFWPNLINTRHELQFFELKNLMTYQCHHSDSWCFYYCRICMTKRLLLLLLSYSYSN